MPVINLIGMFVVLVVLAIAIYLQVKDSKK